MNFLIFLVSLVAATGEPVEVAAVEESAVVEAPVAVEAPAATVEPVEAPAAAAPIAGPFPEFAAALTDCLAYFDNGDISVFNDGTETMEGVGTLSVFYPAMTNPPKYQIVVSQSGSTVSCGGTGAAAPRAIDIDTTALLTLRQIFDANEMVEVKFPEPTRVWANCNTSGDRFVMLVPGAGDLMVMNAAGNEPTAKVYCDAFGVK